MDLKFFVKFACSRFLRYFYRKCFFRSSVVPALLMSGRQLGTTIIQVTHAIEAISKPLAKSNEAAQREIEEAMSKVSCTVREI